MPVFKTRIHPTNQAPPAPVPMALTHLGPVVQLQLEVSDALSKELVESKQQVPAPVSGRGLIDTGATFSAIDNSVAKRMGLQPIGTVRVGTAGGRRAAPVYALKITIVGGGNIVLNDNHVTGVDLDGTDMLALLGRSFLQNVILIYDGISAEFTIAL